MEEFAEKVRLVVVASDHGVVPTVVVSVHVPSPRLIVRVPLPEALNAVLAERVTLLSFALQSIVPPNAPQVIL